MTATVALLTASLVALVIAGVMLGRAIRLGRRADRMSGMVGDLAHRRSASLAFKATLTATLAFLLSMWVLLR